jgi:SAM-dependent methyltransferase
VKQAGIKYVATSLAGVVARNPIGWRLVFWAWALKRRSSLHPIDRAYGIRTSRELPPYLIAPLAEQEEINAYVGCHPNCVRHAIQALPDTRSATFFDFGCGRGRAMIVASEFPFRQILGIDLSPVLCADARDNAAIVSRSYPNRPPITVIEGDATNATIPSGNVVAFIYHAFGPATLARVIGRLETAAQGGQDVTIIYENPLYAYLVDDSPVFTRWHGEQVACEPEERPHHPDADEAIAIWRSGIDKPTGREDFEIAVITPDRRAEIVRRPRW